MNQSSFKGNGFFVKETYDKYCFVCYLLFLLHFQCLVLEHIALYICVFILAVRPKRQHFPSVILQISLEKQGKNGSVLLFSPFVQSRMWKGLYHHMEKSPPRQSPADFLSAVKEQSQQLEAELTNHQEVSAGGTAHHHHYHHLGSKQGIQDTNTNKHNTIIILIQHTLLPMFIFQITVRNSTKIFLFDS